MPSNDALHRSHQILVQEISETRPEYLTQPFTVAEMNGDYEDVLSSTSVPFVAVT